MDTLEGSAPPEPAESPFWSPWATVGWGLLVAAVFVGVQTAVILVWAVVGSTAVAEPDPGAAAARATLDGDVLAAGTLATALSCSALLLGIVAIKRGARPREALGLIPTSGAVVGRWLALTAGLIVLSDTLTWLLGRPIVPEFMTDVIATADVAPLLWLAIIVAAPVFEELFIRGFLLEGLRRGTLGDAGAIVLTALFWASIHLQYGLYEIATIFVFGLVLGLARLGSGSLWVPVAMHVTANLVATVEATIAG